MLWCKQISSLGAGQTDQYQPRAICANLNLRIHNPPAGLLAARCLALRDLQMHEMARGLAYAEVFFPISRQLYDSSIESRGFLYIYTCRWAFML